ncbi:MAG TPA: hypothetical protein VGK49_11230, partial [Ilumatobacteraceae bacterium]
MTGGRRIVDADIDSGAGAEPGAVNDTDAAGVDPSGSGLRSSVTVSCTDCPVPSDPLVGDSPNGAALPDTAQVAVEPPVFDSVTFAELAADPKSRFPADSESAAGGGGGGGGSVMVRGAVVGVVGVTITGAVVVGGAVESGTTVDDVDEDEPVVVVAALVEVDAPVEVVTPAGAAATSVAPTVGSVVASAIARVVVAPSALLIAPSSRLTATPATMPTTSRSTRAAVAPSHST